MQEINPAAPNIDSMKNTFSTILNKTAVDDDMSNKLTKLLFSLAASLSKSDVAKKDSFDDSVEKSDPVTAKAEIVQPNPVKKTQKIKEKNIKIKAQKKSVKTCLKDGNTFPPYPQF